MDALRLSHREVGISSRFPISHLIDDTIFESREGQLGSVLLLEGLPFETALPDELNSHQEAWHQAINQLGEEFFILRHVMHRNLDLTLEGRFPDVFSTELDQRYREQFKHSTLYRNEQYLTLLYKGLDAGKFGKTLTVLQSMNRAALKSARGEYRQKAREKLEKARGQLMALLHRFRPQVLTAQAQDSHQLSLLNFFSAFINGLMPAVLSTPPGALHSVDPDSRCSRAVLPQSHLGHALSAARLFFGEYLEFQWNRDQSRYAAMLSIKSYGCHTHAFTLAPLLQLEAEFLETNSFAAEPLSLALNRIKKQLIRFQNSNDPALSQQQALFQLQDDLASQRVTLGYHHHTLMLIHPDMTHLKKMVQQAIRLYREAGMVAVEESLGMEPCFWSQIPMNQKYRVRASLITSRNFADLTPFQHPHTGYRDQNHLGHAVTLLETVSKTPLFFNFHARGHSSHELTPGHTTIIGGNGSGKTVLIGFMDAQMGRYGGQSFFFDRDRGLEIYIRAAGGTYFSLNPERDPVPMNPFALPDTPGNRSFLKHWLAHLVLQEDEPELPDELQHSIDACVDYTFESLSPQHRSLSTVVEFLPIDFPRWHRLYPWLREKGARLAGQYAYLFDHEADALHFSTHKIGFDLTALMSQPSRVLTAVMLLLFHRIESALNGQRVSIYIDEGWMVLNHPYWADKLKQWLPTLRKRNCHIVLATQSPESIVESALSAQFLDNAATHLFFCNEKANFEKHYRFFNVSESEFDFIKNTPRERRLFLYKQDQMSALCRLNLRGMEDLIGIISANTQSIRYMDELIQTVGADPAHWVPLFKAYVLQRNQA